MEPSRSAVFEASPNIALVKYWGSRDPRRVLPYNSSISVTLAELRTRTRVEFNSRLDHDEFRLAREIVDGSARAAVEAMLDRVRAESGLRERARVDSENNFPTASGLASSASGFAALAGAAAAAAGLRLSPRKISQLARQGSGSASRSVFGGYVEWRAGRKKDGSDSYAIPFLPRDHWPALVDLVVEIRGAPVKRIRSAVAMQMTVRTSPDYRERQRGLPSRLRRIRSALRSRDAGSLFDLLMTECDSFRHVCETTRPSLDYLTPASRRVLAAVRAWNSAQGLTMAGYTHDAGAHVHVFTTRNQAGSLSRALAQMPGISRVRILRPGPGLRRVL